MHVLLNLRPERKNRTVRLLLGYSKIDKASVVSIQDDFNTCLLISVGSAVPQNPGSFFFFLNQATASLSN